jgi:hypothetical protein
MIKDYSNMMDIMLDTFVDLYQNTDWGNIMWWEEFITKAQEEIDEEMYNWRKLDIRKDY